MNLLHEDNKLFNSLKLRIIKLISVIATSINLYISSCSSNEVANNKQESIYKAMCSNYKFDRIDDILVSEIDTIMY